MTIGDDGIASRCGGNHDYGKDGVCRDCHNYEWTLDEVREPLIREGHALYKNLAKRMQDVFGRPIYADDQMLIALALQQRIWKAQTSEVLVRPLVGPIQPMPEGTKNVYYVGAPEYVGKFQERVDIPIEPKPKSGM